MSVDLHSLVGKTIIDVRVEPSGDFVFFKFPESGVLFEAYGDCCSRSWIERISGVQNLIDETIIRVETLELPDPVVPEGRYECLAVYGERLHTAKGACEIEYRNDSNGYYGGWLEETQYDTARKLDNCNVRILDEWICNDAERKVNY